MKRLVALLLVLVMLVGLSPAYAGNVSNTVDPGYSGGSVSGAIGSGTWDETTYRGFRIGLFYPDKGGSEITYDLVNGGKTITDVRNELETLYASKYSHADNYIYGIEAVRKISPAAFDFSLLRVPSATEIAANRPNKCLQLNMASPNNASVGTVAKNYVAEYLATTYFAKNNGKEVAPLDIADFESILTSTKTLGGQPVNTSYADTVISGIMNAGEQSGKYIDNFAWNENCTIPNLSSDVAAAAGYLGLLVCMYKSADSATQEVWRPMILNYAKYYADPTLTKSFKPLLISLEAVSVTTLNAKYVAMTIPQLYGFAFGGKEQYFYQPELWDAAGKYTDSKTFIAALHTYCKANGGKLSCCSDTSGKGITKPLGWQLGYRYKCSTNTWATASVALCTTIKAKDTTMYGYGIVGTTAAPPAPMVILQSIELQGRSGIRVDPHSKIVSNAKFTENVTCYINMAQTNVVGGNQDATSWLQFKQYVEENNPSMPLYITVWLKKDEQLVTKAAGVYTIGQKTAITLSALDDLMTGKKEIVYVDSVSDTAPKTYKYSAGINITWVLNGVTKSILLRQEPRDDFASFIANNDKPHYYSEVEVPYSEIKTGTINSEPFNAMEGTPTTRNLYFASGGSEFVVQMDCEFVQGQASSRSYSMQYTNVQCENFKESAVWVPTEGGGGYMDHSSCHHDHDQSTSISWTQQITGFAYMKITNCKVWKLSDAKVDGMYELLEQDVVTASVQATAPDSMWNIAQSNTAAEGRLYHSYQPASGDSYTFPSKSGSNSCTNYTANNYADFAGVIAGITDKVTCVSDYLILRTSNGDQAILYYEYDCDSATPIGKVSGSSISADPIKFTKVLSEDIVWKSNGMTAKGISMQPGDVTYGGYNGNFMDTTNKYVSSGTSENVNISGLTISKAGYTKGSTSNSGSIVVSDPTSIFKLAKYDLNIPDTKANKEYITGRSQVFYRNLVNYGSTQPFYPITTCSGFSGQGFTLNTTYGSVSGTNDKINNVVVHNPVSAEDAMIVSLDNIRDQRTTQYKDQETPKQVVDETCPGIASECAYSVLNCQYTGSHTHTSACYTLVEVAGEKHDPYVTTVYNYKGSAETVTLGPGTYTLECWGAQGGPSMYKAGGNGGYAKGSVTFTQDTTITINVGGMGSGSTGSGWWTNQGTGGYNGGGAPGNDSDGNDNNRNEMGGGGGGYTTVKANSQALVTAGGGGGRTYTSSPGGAATGGAGGGSYNTTGHAGTLADSGGIAIGGVEANASTLQYASGWCYSSATNTLIKSASESFETPTGSTEVGHTGNGAVKISSNDGYVSTGTSGSTSTVGFSPNLINGLTYAGPQGGATITTLQADYIGKTVLVVTMNGNSQNNTTNVPIVNGGFTAVGSASNGRQWYKKKVTNADIGTTLSISGDMSSWGYIAFAIPDGWDLSSVVNSGATTINVPNSQDVAIMSPTCNASNANGIGCWNNTYGSMAMYLSTLTTSTGSAAVPVGGPWHTPYDTPHGIFTRTTSGTSGTTTTIGEIRNFSYTGSYQEITLEPGTYKLETWGAQGGKDSYTQSGLGGPGGYASGIITFTETTKLYMYVGGQGNNGNDTYASIPGGFNGGGISGGYGGSGGGATDFRTSTSVSSRILVAGGGGGSGQQSSGGPAEIQGGQYDTNGSYGSGASATYTGTEVGGTPGSFDNGAGGGGYRGGIGGTGPVGPDCGGDGGSNYIAANLTEPLKCNGATTFKSPSGANEKGHMGNGNARVTTLKVASDKQAYKLAILSCSEPHHGYGSNWKTYVYGLTHKDGKECTGEGDTNTTPIFFPGLNDYIDVSKLKTDGYIVQHSNGQVHISTNQTTCDYCGQSISKVLGKATDGTTTQLTQGTHYPFGDETCWDACNNDENHKVNQGSVTPTTGGSLDIGDFINIDYAFTVYFPNIGDFYGNGALATATTGQQTGYGYTDNMDTTEWTKKKVVIFPYNVVSSWDNVSHLAGTEISLPVSQSYFEFYCVLNNKEWDNAQVKFYSIPINNTSDYIDNALPTNFARDKTLAARHAGYKEQYIDVVGRIGALTIEDTGDFRFSNLFKKAYNPVTKWIIPNTVPEVNTASQNNLMSDAYDVRGKLGTNATNMFDTYFTSPERQKASVLLPLTPQKNNIAALTKQPLRPGYPIYMDLSTLGCYYGENSDAGENNGATNFKVQITPYYYYLNLKTGKWTPVDVYMNVNNVYKSINVFGNTGDAAYDFTSPLNWVEEAGRRNITQEIVDRTLIVRDMWNVAIPTGTSYTFGTAQRLHLKDRTRVFVGSETQNTVNHDPSGIFDDLYATRQGQRWNFTVKLPSSAVFVEHGKQCTQANINALTSNSSVIVCALDIIAAGEVWNLRYDGTVINAPFKVTDNSGTYDPINGPGTPPGDKPVIGIFSIDKTSKDDLSVIGTH